jgi:eukaryotic-like serine/threonine-protein kinase
MLLATAGLLHFGPGIAIDSSGPTATQIPVSAASDLAESAPPLADTMVAVPSVVGKPLDRASEDIRKAGLAVGSQQAEPRRGAAPFEVLSQTPGGGTQAARGSRIDFVYARPRPSVPVVVGLPLDDAIARLRAAGFAVGRLTEVRTNDARARHVVTQSQPARSKAGARMTIDLTYARPLPTTSAGSIVVKGVKGAMKKILFLPKTPT